MPNALICSTVNIFTIPEVDEQFLANPKTQITIGDLHGNTIKLLFLLVKHGFVANYDQVSGAYAKLVDLYTKPWGTVNEQGPKPIVNPNDSTLFPTALELEEFSTALDSITFKSDATVLLIGDELADRGRMTTTP